MSPRSLLIDLTVMAGIGVLLALLGPFGMYEAPFALRLFYWLLMMLIGYALFVPAMRRAGLFAARLEVPEPAAWAALCALVSIPATAVVWCANFLFSGPHWPSLEAAVTLYGNVLIVAGLACLVMYFLGRERRIAPASSAVPELLDRLPAHLGRNLVALEMEDHYVRAHTEHGSALLLMRMSDAVRELGGLEGAQVHRSWWVAKAAVTAVSKDGRNVRLTLANGLKAPVARAQVQCLRDAGWLGKT